MQILQHSKQLSRSIVLNWWISKLCFFLAHLSNMYVIGALVERNTNKNDCDDKSEAENSDSQPVEF